MGQKSVGLDKFGLQGRDGIAECVRQGRRLGLIRPSTRLSIEAPEIAPEQLIPLPKDTVLCRQPRYSHKSLSEKSISSEIEVHPQRDQLVAILMRREAEIRAATRIAKAKPTAQSKKVSIKPKAETRDVSQTQVATRTMPPVQPESSLTRPPWAFLKPMFASA